MIGSLLRQLIAVPLLDLILSSSFVELSHLPSNLPSARRSFANLVTTLQAMTTDLSRLTIHVFGAGKGESIVLNLPNGKWGVVDCFAGSSANASTSPVLQFLRNQGVEQLPKTIDPSTFKSRLALLQKMGGLSATRPHQCGRCTLVFDNSGNCVETSFDGPAGLLPVAS